MDAANSGIDGEDLRGMEDLRVALVGDVCTWWRRSSHRGSRHEWYERG